jgi:hypothetical protein
VHRLTNSGAALWKTRASLRKTRVGAWTDLRKSPFRLWSACEPMVENSGLAVHILRMRG